MRFLVDEVPLYFETIQNGGGRGVGRLGVVVACAVWCGLSHLCGVSRRGSGGGAGAAGAGFVADSVSSRIHYFRGQRAYVRTLYTTIHMCAMCQQS